MRAYLELLQGILVYGENKKNRTGIDTLSVTGEIFSHDMRIGFPLLTTKKMNIKNIAVELEFFIKGLKDKKWLQDRGCHIWDEWGNPVNVYNSVNDLKRIKGIVTHEEKLKIQKEEMDLGPIYGNQWRDWNWSSKDQFQDMIDLLKSEPTSRRNMVMAWNPSLLHYMALPPCHYSFQVLSDGTNLDLLFNMRSVDVFLGLPYDIASYAILMKLIAKETHLKARKLVAFLADTHIYNNHKEQARLQLTREPKELPNLLIRDDNWTGINNWTFEDYELLGYESHPAIKAEVAI